MSDRVRSMFAARTFDLEIDEEGCPPEAPLCSYSANASEELPMTDHATAENSRKEREETVVHLCKVIRQFKFGENGSGSAIVEQLASAAAMLAGLPGRANR